MNFGQKSHI